MFMCGHMGPHLNRQTDRHDWKKYLPENYVYADGNNNNNDIGRNSWFGLIFTLSNEQKRSPKDESLVPDWTEKKTDCAKIFIRLR